MKKTGIFYATKGGTAEAFAKQIAEKLDADIFNMKDTKIEEIANYKNVVLMSSNYAFGALADDWGGKVKNLHTIDFCCKNVAIVGVGSQERHPDSFCSGAADFYDKLRFSGARFVGAVNACNYKFDFSRLQSGNKMLGLCLDKGDDKSASHIDSWVQQVKPIFDKA
ncbi:flavodoxin domain-containing protein [Treponema phagedenis]|uniref:flavodoxin domain-containing protein n=1 Tax=Treponema phagedenis TaxID=162 RepID=UPI00197F0D49|nr:flavodoxin domain-containing protein [Treponema phagedenis]QSH93969.1 flavodoxin [Treponema phagedenis]